MNCRRGVVLAAIHVAIAGTLTWWNIEVRAAVQKTWGSAAESNGIVLAAQEEQTVNFNPCEMWSHFSSKDHLIIGLDLPAVVVTGQLDACPRQWTVGALIQPPGKPFTRQSYERLAIAFAVLVAVQWFLVGAFPSTQARRWWNEPGAFITACGCIGGGPLVLLTLASLIELKAQGVLWYAPDVVDVLAILAGGIALLAWFWWLGLLVWRVGGAGWRMVRLRMKAA